MPNTTPQTAPPGALNDTPQPDFGKLFGEFARFMQKEQYNPITTMENTNNQPLTCYGVFPNNIAANAPKASVQIVTESKSNGYWKTTGYINGQPSCSSYSKDRAYNIKDVTEILAAAGHFVPKQLAPVMSAKLEKKSNRKAA